MRAKSWGNPDWGRNPVKPINPAPAPSPIQTPKRKEAPAKK